jgi:hypothetical protein
MVKSTDKLLILDLDETQIKKNVKLMNHTSEMDDDLQPEYDFTQLTVVSRGEGRKKSNLTVQLDPDRRKIPSDSGVVNK